MKWTKTKDEGTFYENVKGRLGRPTYLPTHPNQSRKAESVFVPFSALRAWFYDTKRAIQLDVDTVNNPDTQHKSTLPIDGVYKVIFMQCVCVLSLIHISEPTRQS